MRYSYDMSDIDNWSKPEVLSSYLGQQLKSGRIALFVGAGISVPFLNVDWTVLVNKLLASKGDKYTNKTLEQEVKLFRYRHFENDTSGYLDAVQQELYSEFDSSFEELRKNATLGAIGALVMASLRGSANGVVTLNFDNLIELYLKYHGFVTESVIEDIYWHPHADVAVYHPHGFLPINPSEPRSHDIVFDADSYARALGSSGSKWREKILSLLRTNICVFVGLSGVDLNLMSWIAEVDGHHPARLSGDRYWGVTFTTDSDPGVAASWRKVGIYCQVVGDYDHELPSFLFNICQDAAS